jgi:hypothetical protein
VLPPHLPEGQEAAMHGGGLGVGEEPVYDAAAAAVDMVALARNSGRKSGSFSGPADGNGSSSGGAAGLGRPSGGRSLASRSVGMAGELTSMAWPLKGHACGVLVLCRAWQCGYGELLRFASCFFGGARKAGEAKWRQGLSQQE